MRKTKEVLRLRFELGLGQRQIARSCGMGRHSPRLFGAGGCGRHRLAVAQLLEHGGSGHQAFERAQEREILPVSITSAYEKLGNLPLPVSETLLEEGTRRMNAVLPQRPAVQLRVDGR